MTNNSSMGRLLPSTQQYSHCTKKKKKSDNKNKPSCVHISLNMYPALWFPPVFGVMSASTRQGSRTGGPTTPSWVGEQHGPLSPFSSAQSSAKGSEHRATDINFPTSLLLNYSTAVANPFACVLVSLLRLSWQYVFAKMLRHPQMEHLRVRFAQLVVQEVGSCPSHLSPLY